MAILIQIHWQASRYVGLLIATRRASSDLGAGFLVSPLKE